MILMLFPAVAVATEAASLRAAIHRESGNHSRKPMNSTDMNSENTKSAAPAVKPTPTDRIRNTSWYQENEHGVDFRWCDANVALEIAKELEETQKRLKELMFHATWLRHAADDNTKAENICREFDKWRKANQ